MLLILYFSSFKYFVNLILNKIIKCIAEGQNQAWRFYFKLRVKYDWFQKSTSGKLRKRKYLIIIFFIKMLLITLV